jgi:hypothetical protein
MKRVLAAIGMTLAWSVCVALHAHEVDQYDIPADVELADLSNEWNQLLFGAVSRGVEKTNQEIRSVLESSDFSALKELKLTRLHSPDALTRTVRRELPNALSVMKSLEAEVHDKNPEVAGGKSVSSYFSPCDSSIYSRLPWCPGPRFLNRMYMLRCGTVKVHDCYIGIDKVSHFTGMGAWYYNYYRSARLAGQTQEEAIATARAVGQYGPISEHWFVGGITCGIYSNADMAANYLGLKYYVNIAEPVVLRGEWHGPMVARHGPYWKIQSHVGPEYFALFVSPHFDEVLNPCLYEWTFRETIRQAVADRREAILARYADTPDRRNPQYFDARLTELRNYFGEDYGHSGQVEKLITVSNTCFQQPLEGAMPEIRPANRGEEPRVSPVSFNAKNPTRPAPTPLFGPP